MLWRRTGEVLLTEHRMRVLIALTGSLLLLVSCANSPPRPSTGLALSCGSGPEFRESDFSKPAGDPASDEAGKALATFLASREAAAAQLPRTSWSRIAEAPAEILFLSSASVRDAPFGMVAMRRENSVWIADTWGGCLPRYQSGAMQASDWDLAASTNPRAVAIDVLVTFAECGQVDDAHTLLESSITYGTKSVTITTWVGRPQGGEGAAGCVASLPRLFTIPLREPVGSRIPA